MDRWEITYGSPQSPGYGSNPSTEEDAEEDIQRAVEFLQKHKSGYIIVAKNSFFTDPPHMRGLREIVPATKPTEV